jgi:hypothetical protein
MEITEQTNFDTLDATPADPKEKLRTTIAAVEALARRRCQCGAGKIPKRSFCDRCFARLPRDLKDALYSPIGKGYEEAWQHALKHLKGECKCHL